MVIDVRNALELKQLSGIATGMAWLSVIVNTVHKDENIVELIYGKILQSIVLAVN